MLVFALAPAVRAEIDFERAIAPVIIQRCLECHNAKDASGGLVLGSADGLKAGGDGGPVIVVAKPDDSSLYQRIAAGEMPPPRQGNSRKLPDAEIRAVRQWIEQGAKWPAGRSLDLYERTTDARAGRDWWSLQPVARPSVPSVASTDRRATAVDAFILARLEKEGLSLAPPAERTALLRRLAIDLTGLPPTAEQLEEFASDPAPDAYQRQVDRLLVLVLLRIVRLVVPRADS
ncbi:MAG TPA: DUF1549 domain-containing protein, partial [Pirellulaceae bacterium]|nr:DUF1549 domain-containing protein [Pirellulaceae bacterium]